jgi:2'-5' RNA ligase
LKYLVAHLLSGEAKASHQKIARELSHRFKTPPLYERIPPHVTVKPPFETDEAGIEEVERVLRALAARERAASFLIRGFGRFGFKTIYLDVVRSPGAVALVRRLLAGLNANVPWLPRYPHEGNKLHASVARFLDRKKFRRMWRLLKGLVPAFSLSFDNVAVLQQEGRSWKVRTIIPLYPEAKGYTAYIPLADEAEAQYAER